MDLIEIRRMLMMLQPTPVQNINIWDEEWENGNYRTSDGSKPASSSANNQIRSKNYIPILPNTDYYIYVGVNVNIRPLFYKADKTFISSPSSLRNATITTPANAYYMTFYTGSGYGTTYNNNISINYPSTDHDYHEHI